MFHANCPACGAPVELKSAAAVMAVCSFCKSTLLRDGETLKDIGKMSAVLEDYARVQIGTTGRYQGRAFTVIGRIQLRYDAGFWNEWYALFDDGSDGWLAEASGQVTMTLASGRPADAVPFESLRPGQSYDADGKRFVLSDVREADCTGGEGELPFRVGQGWRARVADGRSKDAFLTLDYSDGTAPVLYLGVATSLKALNCQLLRSDQDIRDSAGRCRASWSTWTARRAARACLSARASRRTCCARRAAAPSIPPPRAPSSSSGRARCRRSSPRWTWAPRP